MLARVFMRSASSKSFIIPPVKFRYTSRALPSAGEGDEEQNVPIITNPVRVTKRDDKNRNIHLSRNVLKEKLLNRFTRQQKNYKDKRTLISSCEPREHHSTRSSQKRDYCQQDRRHNLYKPVGELIYGLYPVQLALDAQRRTFHHLMYKKGCEVRNEKIRKMVNTAASRGIKTTGLSPSQFRRVLKGDQVHQGVCCDVSHLPFEAFQVTDYLQVMREGNKGEGKDQSDTAGSCKKMDGGERLKVDQVIISGKDKERHTHEHLNIVTAPIMREHLVNCGKEIKENEVDTTHYMQNSHDTPTHMSKENQTPQLWIYLDQIQDPMNFGAVLRSAYFFGVDKILTSKHNSCALSGVVSKASSGVAEVVPVYTLPHPSVSTLGRLSAAGWVLAASAHQDSHSSTTPVDQFTPRANTILVVGSEGEGVQEEVLGMCDVILTVPPASALHPAACCLNVSAATAVLLHSLRSSLRHTTQVSR